MKEERVFQGNATFPSENDRVSNILLLNLEDKFKVINGYIYGYIHANSKLFPDKAYSLLLFLFLSESFDFFRIPACVRRFVVSGKV